MELEGAGDEPGGWEAVKQQDNKTLDVNDMLTVIKYPNYYHFTILLKYLLPQFQMITPGKYREFQV